MSEWQALSEIPNGSIFETGDGIQAVKSEYRYSNEYPAIQCILLASGEYAHFAQHIKDPITAAQAHNAMSVRVLEIEDAEPGYHGTMKMSRVDADEIASWAKDQVVRERMALLEGVMRDLAVREPRDPGHANKLPQCTLCGASVAQSDWEAYAERHDWNALNIASETTILTIPHVDTCPYRRAVDLTL